MRGEPGWAKPGDREGLMGKISGFLAIVTGVVLALVETWLNWGDWQWWPYFVVDYLAAALLLIGGYRTLRKMSGGLRLLSGAWGFTAGMIWIAFFITIEQQAARSDFTDSVSPQSLVLLMGLLLVVSLAGLAMTVLHKESKA